MFDRIPDHLVHHVFSEHHHLPAAELQSNWVADKLGGRNPTAQNSVDAPGEGRSVERKSWRKK